VNAHAELAKRKTLVGRRPWWTVSARPARLFLTKAYHRQFIQPFARSPVVADQRLYSVVPKSGDVERLARILNSSLTALAIEATGRASMGEGALELSVGDAQQLPVLHPDAFDERVLDNPRYEAARVRVTEERLLRARTATR
jgi:hypothetical protein